MLKKIIVFLSVALLSQGSYGATAGAMADDGRGEVLKRQRVGVCTEDIAILFIKKLHEEGKELEKTKVHKFLYFMNGLNYAIDGTPIVKEPFEAHKYGPIQPIVQRDFDRILKKAISKEPGTIASGPPGGEPLESKIETIFSLFKSYKAFEISQMTHESDTPWSEIRKKWEEPRWRLADMSIPLNLDRDYFTKPKTIERFFLEPYIRGQVNRNDHTTKVLSLLLDRHSSLLDDYISKLLNELEGQFSKIKDVPSEKRSGADLGDQIQEFIEQAKGLSIYDDIFRPHVHKFFVHNAQSLTEGLLAETLYPFDFMIEGEINLFFNASFRQLTALAAGFKSLPALYYLGRIFETFLEEDVSDEESTKAGAGSSDDPTFLRYTREVQDLLQTTARSILAVIPAENPLKPSEIGGFSEKSLRKPISETVSDTGFGAPAGTAAILESVPTNHWQDAYAKVLAVSYQSGGDITDLVDQGLSIKTLPERYRKDLLKRGFSYTMDRKYIEQALRRGFQEFYVMKASNSSTESEAFSCFEQGVRTDIPEAFFEAGKMVLRFNYSVPKESLLWEKFEIDISDTPSEEQKKNLGERLLREAISRNVEPALVLFIDLCEDQFDKAITACESAGNKPWALYQKAKIKERQYKLEEAIRLYSESGPLLGYRDAARLTTSEEESELLTSLEAYKAEVFKALYDDFKKEYMG